ncbi:MAG: hypothetical protein GWP18_00150 [Proteobacteria bacterium]|nr:hypothetical protein [Pseudomonadota bacterium]
MERIAVVLFTIFTILTVMPVSGGSERSRYEEGGFTDVDVIGANADQTDSIDRALLRFELAGIPLPPLDIEVHPSRDGCRDHDGLFTPRDGRDRLDLCTESQLILLHELGHAWDVNFATDRVRRTLLDSWGVDAWSGIDIPYRERGSEKAATLIALALIDLPLNGSDAVASREMLIRFELLTGVPSPRYEGVAAELDVQPKKDTTAIAAQYAARTAG